MKEEFKFNISDIKILSGAWEYASSSAAVAYIFIKILIKDKPGLIAISMNTKSDDNIYITVKYSNIEAAKKSYKDSNIEHAYIINDILQYIEPRVLKSWDKCGNYPLK